MRDGEEQRPCRILLVDDSESYRTALSKLLSREKDVYIVGEAADGRAALELTLKLRPDVLIMDVMMPRKQSLRRYKRVAKGRCLPRGPLHHSVQQSAHGNS
jgi:chemotaxis response regulator CheB